MSNPKLSAVLKKISDKVQQTEELRRLSGNYITEFKLDGNAIREQIELQIFEKMGYKRTPKREQVIASAVKKYVVTLARAYKNNSYLGKAGGFRKQTTVHFVQVGPQLYLITIHGSADNFRAFKDTKREYTRILETDITKGFNIAQKDSPFIRRATERNKTQGGLLDLGHYGDSEIAANITNLLFSEQADAIREVAAKDVVLRESLKKVGFTHSPDFVYQIQDESASDNRARGALGDSVLKAAKEVIEKLIIERIEGSPSMVDEVNRLFKEAAAGKQPKYKKSSTIAKKETKIKQRKRVVNSTAPNVSGDKEVQQQTNWLSIIAMINAKLPQVVASNMGSPRLNYRTGAFAESVRVADVTQTAQGYASLGITYDKTPYGVFDRTNGAAPWNTPERDPHTLIEMSLRQIAQQIIKERFYVRRL